MSGKDFPGFAPALPPEWEAVPDERLAGTVMVVGAADTGKSTLVRYLCQRLCRKDCLIGWLDADMGQPTLGVPATINLALLSSHPEAPPDPRAVFFTGSTSPRGHMLPTLVGVHRLREKAVSLGAKTVLVDTTGLVSAEGGGVELKHWKMELLRPSTVLSLSRADELEPILDPLRRGRSPVLLELPVSPQARIHSPEERAARRARLFRRCFDGAREIGIPPGLPAFDLPAAPGTLLALQDGEGFALGLGVLTAAAGGELKVLTALMDLTRVASLRGGDLRIDPENGEERE